VESMFSIFYICTVKEIIIQVFSQVMGLITHKNISKKGCWNGADGALPT
jgi:hypothetical protein